MSGEYLGDFIGTETIPIVFDTFDSNGASVTMTGLATTDIEIYKGASVTQRSSDSGYTLIDTDGIDIDGATGIHGFTVDLSDDTDSGFYATGNDFYIVVNAVTVDSQTVRFIAARFSIQNRYNPTAAAIADAVWDEALSGHQTAGTAGRNLTLSGTILSETTLTGTPTTTVVRLTAGSSTDDFYNDMELYFITGNAAGLSRIITDYDGTNRDVTFDEALPVTPSASDAVVVKTNHKHSRSQIATSVRTEMDSNSTQLTAIVADTNELQTDWANGGRLDNVLDARARQTSVDTIDTNVQDIQTRLPAALVSGRMSSDTEAISGSTTAADKLEASAETIVTGAATSTTLSTTQMSTNLTEATDDHYNGRILIWTSGVLQNQATDITDYNGTTKTLTYTATTEAPSDTDTFVIV